MFYSSQYSLDAFLGSPFQRVARQIKCFEFFLALGVLLDKKDPVRRAKRAVARTTERAAPGQEEDQASQQELVVSPAPGQDGGQS